MPWCGDKLVDKAVVGLAAALGGWFVSAYGVLTGVLGCIGSRWLFLEEGRVVQFVYPHLEVGQDYTLGTVEAPWQEVAGRSPLELLGGSPLDQVWCSVVSLNMTESAAGA